MFLNAAHQTHNNRNGEKMSLMGSLVDLTWLREVCLRLGQQKWPKLKSQEKKKRMIR
jgi:hypothetical protein